jgi:hypothetical protein
MIVSVTKRIFFEVEKILFASDNICFATKNIFSVVEKTVGEAPPAFWVTVTNEFK